MEEINLEPLINLMVDLSPHNRSVLLPALHGAQQIYGYIPEEAAKLIGEQLNIPLADIFGVIEFYTLFFREPVGETVVHVCNDPACALAGSETLLKNVNQKYTYHDTLDGYKPKLTIERSACLGLCESAPAILVQGRPVMGQNIESWEELISGGGQPPKPYIGGKTNFLTQNCKRGEFTPLITYVQTGGYSALEQVIHTPPEEIIEQIKNSGLVGRGGAAFPTGVKWQATARETSPIKYVVCNGDEAEPGTFKDRIMMENDPHRIIEGMIICAYAIGANKGYFYIRGEYLTAFESITKAISEARKAGFLGENILEQNFSFDIEVRRGAGAYVCGEETALFESIEGKRGFPRIKPPFPTQAGLFGKPTVINNVETLSNIPLILNLGVEKYRAIGTEKSPGPKLFCLSGDIAKPGLYEIPFGLTLRALIFDLAGGIKHGRKLKTCLIGGAAGAFTAEADLDVRLTFEDLRVNGLPLGSGVITVFDETRNMMDICQRLALFFAEESCGKCYPCQLGTQRQVEIINRINNGEIHQDDPEKLRDIIDTMTDSSLCGLGQTAGSAIRSAIKLWPQFFTKTI